MSDILIEKKDDVYALVHTSPDIAEELKEKFTFKVPNYQFTPKYQAGIWDGNIYLFNPYRKKIYGGLVNQIYSFAIDNKYSIEIDPQYLANEFSVIEAEEFIASLKTKLEARDYQLDSFVYSIRNNRALHLLPTSSGKSFLIYLLLMYYQKATLIIVPTTSLIHQMASDFRDYGYTGDIHKIYQGQDVNVLKAVTISTWQSIFKLPERWFQKYKLVIGDECHLFKANSLKTIMENMTNTPYRFGFTGTLDGSLTHRLVLEGLFGRVKSGVTTKQLMDSGVVSNLTIKAIVLNYPDEYKKLMASNKFYQKEIDWLVSYEPRNKFIKNLALSLKGNTLLLFQYVDKHGKVLYDMLKDSERKVFFIHGGVEGEVRNEIRAIVEKETDAIIVASYGTFSTGINVINLSNLIFAMGYKSQIKNLQSIGRVLRKGEGKSEATLFDISDDLKWKKRINYSLGHFAERLKIYQEQKFKFKIYNVRLK